MNDPDFEKLHDGLTYKVYADSAGWWDPLRYIVTRPGGGVLRCTITLRGARWVIRRAMRKSRTDRWWQSPIVAEVDAGEQEQR